MIYHLEKIYRRSLIIQSSITFVYYCAIASIFFFYSTISNGDYFAYSYVLNVLYFVIFTIDWIMRLVSTKRAIGKYLISFESCIPLLTVISVIPYNSSDFLVCVGWLRFPMIVCIVRLCRLLELDHLTISIVEIILKILGFLLVASGIVFILFHFDENNFSFLAPNIKTESFFDSFYFVVVTVATVGYGDITPNTGRSYIS